jgi:dynein heavy chain
LQTYARKTAEAIDNLTFRTNILKYNKKEVYDVPEHGLYIHGLFLQGASWDVEQIQIRESIYGELWDEMPCIW